jgi:Fur family transcriptional regulator, ferric uptake regulator
MPDRTFIESLLSSHQIRKTNIRLAVLDLFIQKKHALSHSEIEGFVGNVFDRVTIYRTLKSFEEQGLIHRVPDESGTGRYALCSHCSAHRHFDRHIHFYCTACQNTFCLDELPIPEIKPIEGYLFTDFSFLVQGVCKNCLSPAHSL